MRSVSTALLGGKRSIELRIADRNVVKPSRKEHAALIRSLVSPRAQCLDISWRGGFTRDRRWVSRRPLPDVGTRARETRQAEGEPLAAEAAEPFACLR